jgi:hypothetical protein
MKKLFALLFKKEEPQFGIKIFQQESWLSKQVNESQFKRNFYLD